MASTGHSGSHSVQSMHSSGSMVRKFGPSWKQSTGQTSTQSMYLHLMQFSVTTKGIRFPKVLLGDAAAGAAGRLNIVPWSGRLVLSRAVHRAFSGAAGPR